MDVTAEKDDLLLRLSSYLVSLENLERRRSEQDISLKATTAKVKQLKKKLSLLKIQKRLLEKTDKEVMRKYGEQNTIIRRIVMKLLKSLATLVIDKGDVYQHGCSEVVFERNIRAELFQQKPTS